MNKFATLSLAATLLASGCTHRHDNYFATGARAADIAELAKLDERQRQLSLIELQCRAGDASACQAQDQAQAAVKNSRMAEGRLKEWDREAARQDDHLVAAIRTEEAINNNILGTIIGAAAIGAVVHAGPPGFGPHPPPNGPPPPPFRGPPPR